MRGTALLVCEIFVKLWFYHAQLYNVNALGDTTTKHSTTDMLTTTNAPLSSNTSSTVAPISSETSASAVSRSPVSTSTALTSASTVSASTVSASMVITSTASKSTVPASTEPASPVLTSMVITSTTLKSTVPASTASASTAPASTSSKSTVPVSTASVSTVGMSKVTVPPINETARTPTAGKSSDAVTTTLPTTRTESATASKLVSTVSSTAPVTRTAKATTSPPVTPTAKNVQRLQSTEEPPKIKQASKTLGIVVYLALGLMILLFIITLVICIWCMVKNPKSLSAVDGNGIELARLDSHRADAMTKEQLKNLKALQGNTLAMADHRLSLATQRLSLVENQIKETVEKFNQLVKSKEEPGDAGPKTALEKTEENMVKRLSLDAGDEAERAVKDLDASKSNTALPGVPLPHT